jgi:hypothetical protein
MKLKPDFPDSAAACRSTFVERAGGEARTFQRRGIWRVLPPTVATQLLSQTDPLQGPWGCPLAGATATLKPEPRYLGSLQPIASPSMWRANVHSHPVQEDLGTWLSIPILRALLDWSCGSHANGPRSFHCDLFRIGSMSGMGTQALVSQSILSRSAPAEPTSVCKKTVKSAVLHRL